MGQIWGTSSIPFAILMISLQIRRVFKNQGKLQQCQDKFLKRMDRRMKERSLRLAITGGGSREKSEWGGLIDMVPGSARRGDQFAILKGCSTPVLLRECRDGYQVIGIVYLEKAMMGVLMDRPAEHWKECNLH